MFDGWGRRVVKFPNDGHPDMCNAVLDIMGDCRDEIVVWNPNELWVYTQDDNPKSGRLYKPIRNPLYNYSNYQVTVSLPGWSEEKSRPRVIATTDGEVAAGKEIIRIDVDDDTFFGAGGIGVWTKADATVSFNALTVNPTGIKARKSSVEKNPIEGVWQLK